MDYHSSNTMYTMWNIIINILFAMLTIIIIYSYINTCHRYSYDRSELLKSYSTVWHALLSSNFLNNTVTLITRLRMNKMCWAIFLGSFFSPYLFSLWWNNRNNDHAKRTKSIRPKVLHGTESSLSYVSLNILPNIETTNILQKHGFIVIT